MAEAATQWVQAIEAAVQTVRGVKALVGNRNSQMQLQTKLDEVAAQLQGVANDMKQRAEPDKKPAKIPVAAPIK